MLKKAALWSFAGHRAIHCDLSETEVLFPLRVSDTNDFLVLELIWPQGKGQDKWECLDAHGGGWGMD